MGPAYQQPYAQQHQGYGQQQEYGQQAYVHTGVPLQPVQHNADQGGGYANLTEELGGKDPHMGEVITGTPLYDDVPPPVDGKHRFLTSGYKDVPAAILFLLFFIGALVLVGIAFTKDDPLDWSGTVINNETARFKEWKLHNKDDWEMYQKWTKADNIIPAGVGGALSAIGWTLCMLLVMRAYPQQFIVGFCVLFTVCMFAMALWLVIQVGFSLNVMIFFLFALIFPCWLYCVRSQIPFAAMLLETSCNIIFRWPATLVVAITQLLVFGVYLFLFLVAVKPFYGTRITTYDTEYDSYTDTTKWVSSTVWTKDPSIGMLFLLIFISFWVAQVISCVVHVTCCGVAATWFFYSATGLPRNSTGKAFKRSMTTSFGSICLGSLLVAILQFIRMLIQILMRNSNHAVRCIVMCILDCIDSLMRYFNRWAFVQVAVYGKSYIQAAKATWAMIMDGTIWRGVVSDCLVGYAISAMNFLIFALTGLITYLVTGSLVAALCAGFAALQTSFVMTSVVDSCVKTIFVCFAESSRQLYNAHPLLHENMCRQLQYQEQKQAAQ
eukprot:Hpha_TRINITY_DN16791_c0_g2::TRINITY_DN16791_c0_g2_i1::g.79436::m.79436